MTPFGLTAANYSFTYVAGTLTVGQATFTGDTLGGAYKALFAPGNAVLTDFRSSPPSSMPMFIVADANIPFEQFLQNLPPTAAGDAAGSERLLDTRCDSSTPWGLLHCGSGGKLKR